MSTGKDDLDKFGVECLYDPMADMTSVLDGLATRVLDLQHMVADLRRENEDLRNQLALRNT